MTAGRIMLTAVFGCLLLQGQAVAQDEITVEIYNDSGSLLSSTLFDTNDPISLSGLANSVGRINVFSTDEEVDADIGVITLEGTWTDQIDLIIGEETVPSIVQQSRSYGRHWAGLSVPFDKPVRFQGRISGDVIGAVRCTNFRRIDVGGDVGGNLRGVLNGPVVVTADGDVLAGRTIENIAGSETMSVLIAGDVVGSIQATAGGIGTVQIVGALTGSILAESDMDEIIILENAGSSVTAATIEAGGEIGSIRVDGHVWADISVNGGEPVDENDEAADLPRLEIFNVGGDLDGTFIGPSISNLNVGGDLHADLTVGLVRHGFLGDDEWRINGSFKNDAVIETRGKVVTVPPPPTGEVRSWGLRGPVVFNNAFDGSEWEEGAIVRVYIVGTSDPEEFITLTGPDYTNNPYTHEDESEGFGGGAVGVASFALHDEGCAPQNGAVEMLGVGVLKLPNLPDLAPMSMEPINAPVVLHHRGPVAWDGAAGSSPVKIERRRIGMSNWHDITDAFDPALRWAGLQVTLKEDATQCGGDVGFHRGFDYRITPFRTGDDALRCRDVTTEPLIAHDVTGGYTYAFRVDDLGCPWDLDADGEVGSDDLALLLGA